MAEKAKQLVTFYRDGEILHTPTAVGVDLDLSTRELGDLITRAIAAVPPARFTIGELEVQVLAGRPPEVADEADEDGPTS